MICEICGFDCERKSNSQRFCIECSDERRYYYNRLYKQDQRFFEDNRDKIGNPKQDLFILTFIKNKREGNTVSKYKPLHNSDFSVVNEANRKKYLNW